MKMSVCIWFPPFVLCTGLLSVPVRGCWIFCRELDIVRPDVFVVNEDGATEEKRRLCEERNIRYVVLPREPKEKLPRRSTTDLRKPAEK